MADEIKLSAEDITSIGTFGNASIQQNTAAFDAIKSVLASSVHVGIAGMTADQLVGLKFKGDFDVINNGLFGIIASVQDGIFSVFEVDQIAGSRLANNG